MKLKYLMIIFILIGIFIGISIIIINDHYKPKDKFNILFDFTLTEDQKMGFNVDIDKLHFGKFNLNGGSKREIEIYNNHSYREKLEIDVASANGSMGSWFYFHPKDGIIIPPKEKITMEIMVYPKNAKIGFYEGEIIIRTYKPWYWEEDNYLYWKHRNKLNNCFSKDNASVLDCFNKGFMPK
jgi:hypothetical protein